MEAREKNEAMTAEAMRAKEEYLFNMGKVTEREICDLEGPHLFTDQFGEQYIQFGSQYKKVQKPEPDKIVKAQPFETFSLDGLIDYITQDTEGLFQDPAARHIVRVKSPTKVEVIAPQRGYWRERELVAYCDAVVPDICFGRYMDRDDFQIMVQTCFMDSENRALVLQLAGNVRKEQTLQTADDGVSQKITVNAGISTAADVIVKNPVSLIPFRTFHEVEQPASPFVLRFDEEGNPALFTGDGSAWKLEAVATVKAYLKDALKGLNVDIIA